MAINSKIKIDDSQKSIFYKSIRNIIIMYSKHVPIKIKSQWKGTSSEL